jgi:hypothetical protein
MNYHQALDENLKVLRRFGGEGTSAAFNCETKFFGVGQFINGCFDRMVDMSEEMKRQAGYSPGAAIYGALFSSQILGLRKNEIASFARKMFHDVSETHGPKFAEAAVVSAVGAREGVSVIGNSMFHPGYYGINDVVVTDSAGRRIRQSVSSHYVE